MELDLKNTFSQSIRKDQILEKISPYDIFYHYIGDFKVGSSMKSPLRIDSYPSFGIYVNKNGDLMFNDFKEGGGSCFKFVEKKFNCSYQEALHIIDRDFNLGIAEIPERIKSRISNIQPKPVIKNYIPEPKSKIKIKIMIREWLDRDKKFWFDKYGIKLETLSLFKVYPITAFWLDNQRFYCKPLSYAYYFEPFVYKIYQPEVKLGKGKWFSNIDVGTKWHGYKQLPETADYMFITKSLKDVMVLYELGFPAVSPHQETPIIPDKVVENLKSRFKKIYVYYDNDETGVTNSTKICNTYGFDYINNPSQYPKDPSDFIEKYNREELVKMINHLIEKKNEN